MPNLRKATSRLAYTEVLKLVKKTSVNYRMVETFFKLTKEAVALRYEDFGRCKPKNWIVSF